MTSRYRAAQRAVELFNALQGEGLTTDEIAAEMRRRRVLDRKRAGDPAADLYANVRDMVADFAKALGQPLVEDALRARTEAAEQRAEAAEADLSALAATVGAAVVASALAPGESLSAPPQHIIVSQVNRLRARAEAAEAEAERLRSAIAETLRLADIYAGVAAHNAEAEPETAGEAWRSPYMATMRELRRALGGAA